MAISEKENELILKYLDERLDKEDTDLFTELKESSEEFRQEVINQQGLMAGIKAHHKVALKKEIENIFADLESENSTALEPQGKSVSFKPQYLWYASAAAVILLLIVFLPGRFQSDPLSNDQLYASFYKPLPLNAATRNEADTPRGLELYQNGEYAQAIKYLDELNKIGEYKMAGIYLGVSYLETNKLAKAESVFQKILTGDSDPFQKQYADWYLILIRLRNGEKLDVVADLNKIVKAKGIYSKEAKELLDAIQ